jgi:hypothetical protein
MNVLRIGNSLRGLAAVALIAVGGAAFAQTAPAKPSSPSTPQAGKPAAPAKPAAQWRRQCVKEGDFCVQVPAAWKPLGEVFEGAGFSVAEPDPQRAAENLNQITATFIDLPQGDKPRPTASELIDIVLGSPAEGTTQETVQRSREVVAGMPTEIVTLKMHSAAGDWTERVALLDADEVVYAVALVCAPEDLARLEPVFKHVLESWSPIPVTPKKP